jgi:hypothetical protein
MMNEVLPILLVTASGLVNVGQLAENVENARAIFREKFVPTGLVKVSRRKLMQIETDGGPDGYVVLVEE